MTLHRTFHWIGIGQTVVVCAAPFAYSETFLSEEQAMDVLFPGQTLVDQSISLSPEQTRAISKSSGVRVRSDKVRAFKASGGGWLMFDSVVGKHEFIDFALALDENGVVKGVELLNYRETYGGEVRSPEWRAQFAGKSIQSHLKLNDDIRNISGATLSSNNLTKGVRRLVYTWNLVLKTM